MFEVLLAVIGSGALVSVFTNFSKKINVLAMLGNRRKFMVRSIAVTLSVIGGVLLAGLDGSLAPETLQQGVLDILNAGFIWVAAELNYRSVK